MFFFFFEKVTSAIMQLDCSITEDEMLKFYDFLTKYPMMGLENSVGRKILDAVKNEDCSLECNVSLFRARSRNKDNRPYSELEMWNPPLGFADQGRYNLHGLSVLYVSNSIIGAASEVKYSENEVIDVIEWRLTSPIKILDLVSLDSIIIDYTKFSSTKESRFKPEYAIPNFVAQCCQLSGIQGIKYTSDKCANAINYVIFEPYRDIFQYIQRYRFDNSLTK